MADTREKFSPLTIAFHWIVALTIISLLAVGLYMEDLPRGEFRSFLYGWHKVIGTTILMIASIRILWRWSQGLPKAAGNYPDWQRKLANLVHVMLLIATVGMPLSGALMSYGGGHPVPILGLFNLQLPEGEKIKWMSSVGHVLHEYGGKLLIGIIALHVAGALKHHFQDRDGTLKRMLGARI